MSMPCIYHIEDNEADRRLLAFALDAHGVPFELNEAFDGEHAIEVLRGAVRGERCWPSLVVLDLNLPKCSGIEVLSRLRGDPDLKTARVVILTSSDSPKDMADAEALGITEYLRKPLGLDDVLALAKHLLQIASVQS